VSVTAVRQRLGKTGSFSTIGPVVTEWRGKPGKEGPAPAPEAAGPGRGDLPGARRKGGREGGKGTGRRARAAAPGRGERTARGEGERGGKGEMLAEITRLEAEIDAQREQTTKALSDLTAERDRYRAELDQVRGSLAAAEGALGEARKRIAEEEHRNRDLSAESA